MDFSAGASPPAGAHASSPVASPLFNGVWLLLFTAVLPAANGS
ncbi:hypothetical protein [Streptomyces sp. NPDC056690]